MESLVKTVRGPQKFIYKHIYSTRNKRNKNVELVDIPTDDETEFDVGKTFFSNRSSKSNGDSHILGRRSANQTSVERRSSGW